MDVIKPVTHLAGRLSGIGIPDREEALACVNDCRPCRMKFRDDGYVPNNPRFPLLHFRKAMRVGRRYDPAAVMEKVFAVHGWGDAWRNGIYEFVHYHSMCHEVLGVARGTATLRLGGNRGRTVEVGAGDVVIIPAGVGHECLKAGKSFLVVGAYPQRGTYNEGRGSFQEHDKAVAAVRRVGMPKHHPLYGSREPVW